MENYTYYATLLQFILPNMQDTTKKVMLNVVIALYLSGKIGERLSEDDIQLIQVIYMTIESDSEKKAMVRDIISNTEALVTNYDV